MSSRCEFEVSTQLHDSFVTVGKEEVIKQYVRYTS